ncbi:hypothetical protein KAFR_0A01840 [Kazachstania africana CBS 2517]|uniref:C2H2-type domain-containing protein n=1 Tax=Kazachstania africana (strain ATCC 22294 / BCRC 22015 / CBS 2517 / CECT 1963 / NBRC 1671 / NRRL Y-8276) TaxID=1071382 RepID=H2AMM2_KAZAF|nr:hypothetical protein KAFR_0A01840 [Kazachstania africana CBS 2517]CCF55622.1 hypothetical protein KAFR_0A01840 [Kazachstania africana CBS 2517]
MTRIHNDENLKSEKGSLNYLVNGPTILNDESDPLTKSSIVKPVLEKTQLPAKSFSIYQDHKTEEFDNHIDLPRLVTNNRSFSESTVSEKLGLGRQSLPIAGKAYESIENQQAITLSNGLHKPTLLHPVNNPSEMQAAQHLAYGAASEKYYNANGFDQTRRGNMLSLDNTGLLDNKLIRRATSFSPFLIYPSPTVYQSIDQCHVVGSHLPAYIANNTTGLLNEQNLSQSNAMVGFIENSLQQTSNSSKYGMNGDLDCDNVAFQNNQLMAGPIFQQSLNIPPHYRYSSNVQPVYLTPIQSCGYANSPLSYQNGIFTSNNGLIPADNQVWTKKVKKKNQCPICGKTVTRSSSLLPHMFVHTGDRPYLCKWPKCGKAFNVKSNMNRHYKLHLKKEKEQREQSDGVETAETLSPLQREQ